MMDTLTSIKKLLELNKNNTSKVEDIEHEIVQRNSEKCIKVIQEVKCGLNKTNVIAQGMFDKISDGSMSLTPEEIRKMKEQIRILEENEADDQKRIARLEKEILGQDGRIEELTRNMNGFKSQLTETRNKLEEIENALKTGQIAFDFEKDLATYIYPNDKKFGSRKTFTNMKKWLEEKKETMQGKEANKKWNALKDEFSWSGEHEKVFFKLLESRKEFAHPTIDQDVAQSQIPDDYTDEEKECIKDIVNMVERVNVLMQQ